MKTNRAIERADNLIQKRIETLARKIDDVKEKYPYEIYGMRCVEKTAKYETEIEELHKYLEGHISARAVLEEAKQLNHELFRAKTTIMDAARILKRYGEFNIAEQLERCLAEAETE